MAMPGVAPGISLILASLRCQAPPIAAGARRGTRAAINATKIIMQFEELIPVFCVAQNAGLWRHKKVTRPFATAMRNV
jgi:hypothetical protein